MNALLMSILDSVAISIVVYFGIAFISILVGRPLTHQKASGLAFEELRIDYTGLPPRRLLTAAGGSQIAFRHYPAQSKKALILLHGSGWHGQYFHPLAMHISCTNTAHVYVPDLRGHGQAPERRGDIDYIGQFEEDLSELIAMIRHDIPGATLVVGGHSSGGGLAARFAESRCGSQAAAYLLLAPYLQHNAPTVRPGSGGWAAPNLGRFVGLTMLNNIGITWLNALNVINFNMPQDVRDGTETLSYSYRLITNYAPRDYRKALRAITQPLLVVVGLSDEVLRAERFQDEINRYTKGQLTLLPGVSHFGVVVGAEVRQIVSEWLTGVS